jgi:3-hydroxyethyl bacteriochlorophyllide a dehydrogenase
MSSKPIPTPAKASRGSHRTRAVVFERPEKLALRWIDLPALRTDEVLVAVEWSGISTGTEKLLWTGAMPPFPGMGYPLVPGYETVGVVIEAGDRAGHLSGQRVFVSGARCYGEVNGLFGGSASRIVVPADKVLPVADGAGESATLLALAATAYHALIDPQGELALPDLVVGHGVLGRLIARLCCTLGDSPPVVWENNASRRHGAAGYTVIAPEADEQNGYTRILDVSGDSGILDALIGKLGRGGEIVLAGFYANALSFAFPPAFMREARIRVAAEWRREDLETVNAMLGDGRLGLDDLITHRAAADEAGRAYPQAFTEAGCLKMILDWRGHA